MMQSMNLDLSRLDEGGMPVVHYDTGPSSPAPPAPGGQSESAEDTAERLKRLDALLEQGLVTADEHRELRKKIIDSI